jgi:hypothetical protein
MNSLETFPVRAPRLSRTWRLMVYLVGGGIWTTGALWLLFHYFFVRETAFGPSPHPLESWSRAAHGAFGFATLWLFGVLWSAHVVEGWRSLRRRWTGSLMFGLFAWLVLSGYLIYYVGNEGLLAATTLLHWLIGLAAPVPFLVHRLGTFSVKRTTV